MLTSENGESIRKTYQIPPTVNIMILMLETNDSDLPLEGWIAFHEKSLWLKLRFSLYLFVRKFFSRI